MPEAILLEDVEDLGEQGKAIDVSKGYLRNYLIPAQARPARHERRDRSDPRAQGWRPSGPSATRSKRPRRTSTCSNRTVLTIPQQAGADGRLFGSVTAQDIATAVREARGLKIDKRGVHMPEPIKSVGTYMVVVEVVEGVTATIKTMVVAKK